MKPFRVTVKRFGFRFNLNHRFIGIEGNRIKIELQKDVEFRPLKTLSPGPVTTSEQGPPSYETSSFITRMKFFAD